MAKKATSPRVLAPAREAFLRLAWRQIIDDTAMRGDEPAWIEGWLRWARSQKQPQGGVGAAIERVLAAGADPADLTDVVRSMQCLLLVNLCDVLDAEGLDALRAEAKLPAFEWRLFVTDVDGKPLHAIESLHESVYSYDPTGRDGEPRSPKPKQPRAKRSPRPKR